MAKQTKWEFSPYIGCGIKEAGRGFQIKWYNYFALVAVHFSPHVMLTSSQVQLQEIA